MKPTRLTTTLVGTLPAALLFAAFVTSGAVAETRPHVMENLSATKWGPAPPMLPPGAEIAVLAGDPGKAAPYVIAAYKQWSKMRLSHSGKRVLKESPTASDRDEAVTMPSRKSIYWRYLTSANAGS